MEKAEGSIAIFVLPSKETIKKEMMNPHPDNKCYWILTLDKDESVIG